MPKSILHPHLISSPLFRTPHAASWQGQKNRSECQTITKNGTASNENKKTKLRKQNSPRVFTSKGFTLCLKNQSRKRTIHKYELVPYSIARYSTSLPFIVAQRRLLSQDTDTSYIIPIWSTQNQQWPKPIFGYPFPYKYIPTARNSSRTFSYITPLLQDPFRSFLVSINQYQYPIFQN